MKKFIFLALLLLVGCGDSYIHPGDETLAVKECSDHQGLWYFQSDSIDWQNRSGYTLTITCRDETSIKLRVAK